MTPSWMPSYVVDPANPRAPPQDVWDGMTPEERARVVDCLPSEIEPTAACPPEGDVHYDAVQRTREMLRGYFRRIGRRIYVGNDLPVYYPAEEMFSPDVIAVLDVEDGPRSSWVVSAEGKGLDLAMEIHWLGHRLKDVERNVVRYAGLGIREYFVLDQRRLKLRGYRLPDAGGHAYRPIVPQAGRYPSEVLGLDVAVEGDRLRFYHGTASLPDAEELIARLNAATEAATAKAAEEAQRAEQEAQRAEQEAQHAKQEAQRAEQEAQRAREMQGRLEHALAELERLKR